MTNPILTMTRTSTICAALLAGLMASAARANPDDALRLELAEMAKQVKSLVDKQGGGAIAVGGFTASSNILGSSGPEIQLKLASELQKAGLSVDGKNYRFEVTGNYLPVAHPETKLQGVKIVGRVIDAGDGATLGEFPRFVFGEETVPRMLGLSVSVPPNADPKERSRAFEQARANPQAATQGTRISARKGSPYGIEVLVKQGNQYVARPPESNEHGCPFVPINTKEIYAVRLINDSPHEAAVVLSIDGLNCFHFSEAEQKGTYWILAPGKRLDVKGWHKTETASIEFKVVDFPDTAAAKVNLKLSETIGTITAAFSASWADDSQKPSDEGTSRGTGFGSQIEFKTTHVKRTIGHVRETIAVRYER